MGFIHRRNPELVNGGANAEQPKKQAPVDVRANEEQAPSQVDEAANINVGTSGDGSPSVEENLDKGWQSRGRQNLKSGLQDDLNANNGQQQDQAKLFEIITMVLEKHNNRIDKLEEIGFCKDLNVKRNFLKLWDQLCKSNYDVESCNEVYKFYEIELQQQIEILGKDEHSLCHDWHN